MADIIEFLKLLDKPIKWIWGMFCNFFTSKKKEIKLLEDRIINIENQLKLINNLQEEHFKCKSCRNGIYLFKNEQPDVVRFGDRVMETTKYIFECSNCHANPPSYWQDKK